MKWKIFLILTDLGIRIHKHIICLYSSKIVNAWLPMRFVKLSVYPQVLNQNIRQHLLINSVKLFLDVDSLIFLQFLTDPMYLSRMHIFRHLKSLSLYGNLHMLFSLLSCLWKTLFTQVVKYLSCYHVLIVPCFWNFHRHPMNKLSLNYQGQDYESHRMQYRRFFYLLAL